MPQHRDLKAGIGLAAYRELYYCCLQYQAKQRAGHGDAALIEQAAQAVAGDMATWLINCVAKGQSWEQELPPCGRRQWYTLRREFFRTLAVYKGLAPASILTRHRTRR